VVKNKARTVPTITATKKNALDEKKLTLENTFGVTTQSSGTEIA
jgi:hypothetical protein